MGINYLYILLFTFVFSSTYAQESFSEDQLHDFVNVYMSHKNEKKRNFDIDRKLFEQYKVTPQRYQQISTAALSNVPIDLSTNEVKLKEELNKHNDLLKIENQNKLEHLCQKYNIPIATYSVILIQYQKDIKFQRALKPYFDTYINGMK